MGQKTGNSKLSEKGSANLSFEAELFKAADKLRDALLPKLISGALRVKDAERFLQERGL